MKFAFRKVLNKDFKFKGKQVKDKCESRLSSFHESLESETFNHFNNPHIKNSWFDIISVSKA